MKCRIKGCRHQATPDNRPGLKGLCDEHRARQIETEEYYGKYYATIARSLPPENQRVFDLWGIGPTFPQYRSESTPDFVHSGGVVKSAQGRLRDLTVEQVAPNIVIFYSKEGNFLKPAGWVMAYFMDTEQAAKEMKAGKIDYPMFMPGSLQMRFAGYSMIDALWKKRKPLPNETPENALSRDKMRHVVGALEAYTIDDGLFIDNISVRPGWKRNTVMTKLMKAVENNFPDMPITHSKTTKKGEAFLKKTGYYKQPKEIEEAYPGMRPSRKQLARGDYAMADTGKRPPQRKRDFLRKPSVRIEPAPTEEEIQWYTRQGFSRVMAKILALERRQRVKEDVTNVLLPTVLESDEGEEWIGVDLDGTLAKYTEWKGATKIGKPISKMAARVRRWVGRGKKVKIFTARADDERSVNAIKKWLKDNELPDLEITNLKDHLMKELWDDRAVAVEKNTGEVKEAKSFHGITHWKGCGCTSRCRCSCQDERTVEESCPSCRAGVQTDEEVAKRMKPEKSLASHLIDCLTERDEPFSASAYLDEMIGDERKPNYAKFGDEEDAELDNAARQPFTAMDMALRRNQHHPKLWKSIKGSPYERDYRKRFNPTEALLVETPQIKTLKDNQQPLEPTERSQVLQAGAVWHQGIGGDKSPAIKKSIVDGQTWYWSNTHRVYQADKTLKAAIRSFHDVVEPSS